MKRIVGLLLVLVLALSVSVAFARKVSCSVGGFSLKLPDDFSEKPCSQDPELCFYWSSGDITVQGYVSYQGEVAGSDLFDILTGNETESGSKTINGMPMRYTRTDDSSIYTWMDRGNNVTLYFYYSAGDSSALSAVKKIMSSIRFDAGH